MPRGKIQKVLPRSSKESYKKHAGPHTTESNAYEKKHKGKIKPKSSHVTKPKKNLIAPNRRKPVHDDY